MSIRPINSHTTALLLLLPLATGCRDDSQATLPAPEASARAHAAGYDAAPPYAAQDLGTLGGINSIAYAINNPGQITGWSQNAAGADRAFVRSAAGAMADHGIGRGWDISESGEAMGERGTYARAFTWYAAWPGAALGVNRGWTAVGYRTGASGERAVIEYFGVQDLGVLPGGTYSRADDVNDSLVVVGHGNSSAGTRAFIVRYPGLMESLGVLPDDTASVASSVNRAGQVVGYSTGASSRAFVWTAAGGMRELGTLPGGTASRAYDINAGGRIVGYAVAADGLDHAVMWTPDGAGYSITDLGGIGGAYPSAAHGINDNGRVVGYTRVGTAKRATLWIPLDSPPVARITGRDTTWAGTPVEFSAAYSAPGQYPIAGYEWGFNANGTFTYSTFHPRIAHSFDLPGTRVAYVRVRDKYGQMDTAAKTVVVLPNRPPVAVIANADTIRTMEGYTIHFSSAGSSDPDTGQPLRYVWTLGVGNEEWGPNVAWRYPTRGTYTVVLTLTDASGVSDADTVQVVVVNAPPTVRVVTGPVLENTPILIRAFGGDSSAVERRHLTYALDCGGGYGTFGTIVQRTCPAMPQGASVNAGAKVRDRDGVIVEHRQTFIVADAPPKVQYVSGAAQNGTFTLTFSFNDPGGAADGPFRYRVVWGDGKATAWVSASIGTVQVSRPQYAPGRYTIVMTVADGAGVTGRTSSPALSIAP